MTDHATRRAESATSKELIPAGRPQGPSDRTPGKPMKKLLLRKWDQPRNSAMSLSNGHGADIRSVPSSVTTSQPPISAPLQPTLAERTHDTNKTCSTKEPSTMPNVANDQNKPKMLQPQQTTRKRRYPTLLTTDEYGNIVANPHRHNFAQKLLATRRDSKVSLSEKVVQSAAQLSRRKKQTTQASSIWNETALHSARLPFPAVAITKNDCRSNSYKRTVPKSCQWPVRGHVPTVQNNFAPQQSAGNGSARSSQTMTVSLDAQEGLSGSSKGTTSRTGAPQRMAVPAKQPTSRRTAVRPNPRESASLAPSTSLLRVQAPQYVRELSGADVLPSEAVPARQPLGESRSIGLRHDLRAPSRSSAMPVLPVSSRRPQTAPQVHPPESEYGTAVKSSRSAPGAKRSATRDPEAKGAAGGGLMTKKRVDNTGFDSSAQALNGDQSHSSVHGGIPHEGFARDPGEGPVVQTGGPQADGAVIHVGRRSGDAVYWRSSLQMPKSDGGIKKSNPRRAKGPAGRNTKMSNARKSAKTRQGAGGPAASDILQARPNTSDLPGHVTAARNTNSGTRGIVEPHSTRTPLDTEHQHAFWRNATKLPSKTSSKAKSRRLAKARQTQDRMASKTSASPSQNVPGLNENIPPFNTAIPNRTVAPCNVRLLPPSEARTQRYVNEGDDFVETNREHPSRPSEMTAQMRIDVEQHEMRRLHTTKDQELKKLEMLAEAKYHVKMNLRGRLKLQGWLSRRDAVAATSIVYVVLVRNMDRRLLSSDHIERQEALVDMENTDLRILEALMARIATRDGHTNWAYLAASFDVARFKQ